ncbi:MAG TPA: cation:proton antiporter [Oceanobacillus sp.]|nr:cation:proton antiporter [Oceanobacillus sp.]
MTETIQFVFALGLTIGFAKLMGYLLYRLNQPAVLGELLAGLIIGPTMLNLLGNAALFPDGESVKHTVIEVAEIGVLLLMFMAGMEVDPQSLKSVGRAAFLTGALGVVVPLVVITPVVVAFDIPFGNALFVGILLASMSTSISAQVMIELGVLRQREGLTLLSAALIDDAFVILLLSVFLAINPGGVASVESSRTLVEVILFMVGFVVIATIICWIFLPKLANLVSQLPISEGPLVVAIVSVLILSFASEYIGGIAGITGAFLAGVCIRRARVGVVEEIERGLHAVNYGVFVPLFFVSIGLQANLRLLTAELLPFALIITLLAIITKIVGSGAGSLLGGLDRMAAFRISLGMVSRGEVGLIIASLGVTYGILEPDLFTIIVFIVLVTTIITPPLLRWSFSQKTATVPDNEETPSPA